MQTQSTPLPDFVRPPLAEVALSLQFEPIVGLRIPQLGKLWDVFRDRFPQVEEHPAIEPSFERFGVVEKAKGLRFQTLTGLPAPRCWFLSRDGRTLIQVQRDRLLHNWRKVASDDAYPRYQHIRGEFVTAVEAFIRFLAEEGLGVPAINQCEVSYINHIDATDGPSPHGQLSEVVSLFSPSGDFLPRPEDARLSTRYVIHGNDGAPIGRLHVAADPAYRNADDAPIIQLVLTARGRPLGGVGISEAMSFIDIGREWVVRGFADVTTSKMHSIWGRKQ